jgi:hypothetical protein
MLIHYNFVASVFSVDSDKTEIMTYLGLSMYRYRGQDLDFVRLKTMIKIRSLLLFTEHNMKVNLFLCLIN